MAVVFAALAALLSLIACILSWLAYRAAGGASGADPQLLARLESMSQVVERAPRELRDDLRGQRDEDRSAAATHQNLIDARLGQIGQALEQRLTGVADALEKQLSALRGESATGREQFETALGRNVESFTKVQREKLDETREAMGLLAGRLDKQHEAARDSLRDALNAAQASQKEALDRVNGRIETLLQENERRQQAIQQTLGDRLDQLRQDNAAKLDQMRETVDQKLQSTLDQRLDANFKQVSDRLESVQRGLGEMQTLATGVGDLKRVLTNVKARGTWGEVQLGALLEDTLTREQYDEQVRVRPRSAETVDFAVRLPGHDETGQVWLPIDCKFPHEDYARLLGAQEAGDPAAVEVAGKALERAIAAQAKSIGEKYICPPATTDFAYMYLPTEGLFAEIVRRHGFAAELRSKYRVEVAGPSTLSALLNSLRVGFRSLQIQKKSSEVWTELGRVKTAFEKYGDALEAVDKKLDEAKSKVADVSKKHRAVVQRLRGVESIEVLDAAEPALSLPLIVEDDEAA